VVVKGVSKSSAGTNKVGSESTLSKKAYWFALAYFKPKKMLQVLEWKLRSFPGAGERKFLQIDLLPDLITVTFVTGVTSIMVRF
jgi:hypothetical protein